MASSNKTWCADLRCIDPTVDYQRSRHGITPIGNGMNRNGHASVGAQLRHFDLLRPGQTIVNLRHVLAASLAAVLSISCRSDLDPQPVAGYSQMLPVDESVFLDSVPCGSTCDRVMSDTLTDETWLVPNIIFGRITSVRIYGDTLLVTDQLSDLLIVSVDLATNTVAARFGRRGGGPYEYRDARWVTRNPADSSTWIYDYQNRRLTRLGSLAGRVPDDPEQLIFSTIVFPTQPVWTAYGFLSNGYFSDHVLLRMDETGSGVGWMHLGAPSTPGSEALPGVRMRLNRTRIARHPFEPRVAVAYQSHNRLDMFNWDIGSATVARGPFDVEPSYIISHPDGGGPRFRWADDFEQAYVAVDASNEHVYALFCGPCMDRSELPRRVHVFDWSGLFLRELVLPRGVSVLAVSEDDAVLVGATNDFVPGVYAWRLKPGSAATIGLHHSATEEQ